MGFWMLAALAALFIVMVLGYALFSPARNTARASAEFDMEIYRDQLKELDRDLARGVVAPEEAERTRVEISRRLLEADRAAQAQDGAHRAPRAASIAATAGIAVLLGLGGAYVYSNLGAPGYPDLPLDLRKSLAAETRENRPDQAAAEAEMPAWEGPNADVPSDYVTLVEQLRTAVARRPGDIQGLALLARHEAALENYRAAHRAQSRLIEARGEDDVGAQDYADLAELLILAAGGYVSPEAETALTRALNIDPQNGVARYYSGLLFAQTGRPDLAFRMWRTLLENSPTDSPWIGPIRAQIGDLARAAGVNYTPREGEDAPRGPSAQDMENAAEMSEEDRAQMIRGMVDGLSERLASEGGPASDWARLLRALGVLGDTERAQAIWSEAQSRFAEHPEDLEQIRAAARDAGVAE
ncbi:c-type cytochrome biogenesis protein CcmI [Maritimibacter sp. UBA3975]|uniref:c-type cytochrome biogenesis protein CcmI n=1 Tax=Maritimibacter sp. UBA3975 TaxID=1946833 RepID=UPI000C09B3CF|nr:c-type cytochrome biogenesis protein CcmI [Maritimibacter sp. UBA3975]MAM61137.1 c-type cytochrome biogenesis protein CcmI [Maritimibacter sp.]|tara:strand:+ start:15016 stop:16254 length:1239 start_codon:yes stop_codon:yes gene_type:complete